MKKKIKKLLALFTSVAMILTLFAGNQLRAAEPDKTGSITVHKFMIEKASDYNDLIGNLSNRGNGNEILDGSLDTYKPFEGISFKLTKVVDANGINVDNAVKDNTFTEVTIATDKDGLAVFNNLPLGIYKLEELDNAAVMTKMDSVLIEVPTYNPEYKTDNAKDEWLYNVHVYPKNLIYQDGPGIVKDVMVVDNNDSSIDIKKAFPWIITTDIPKGISTAKEYKILDNLDSQLDYVSNPDVSVIMKKKDNTTIPLTKGTDFTFEAGENNRSLVFDFESGLAKLAEAEEGKLVITFHTQLNDTAKLGTEIKNKAQLNFTNSSNQQYKPDSDVPEIHTGGVSIKKVDKADEAIVLEGAKFKIYPTENDAKAGTNAIKRDGTDYEVISGADGIATFEGLAYGENGGAAITDTKDYWIVETQAPTKDGVKYNRLLNPFKVTVSATSHTQAYADDHVVENANKNYDLPFTGGNGVWIYIIAGATLISAGVVLLFHNKKNAARKN